MTFIRRIIVILIFFATSVRFLWNFTGLVGEGDRKLIIISIDGFRYDYLLQGLTPTIDRLRAEGCWGALRSQFPSYTFPNHYTIVTGLYPAIHGIVSNTFFDSSINQSFYQARKDPKWWLSDPVWNVAEREEIITASVFWPGSNININGMKPTYTAEFNLQKNALFRIRQAIKWLKQRRSPRLTLIYLSELDEAGHWHGVDSREMKNGLRSIDKAIRYLLATLQRLDITNFDLIILGDHGFQNINKDGVIYLEDIYSEEMLSDLQWYGLGTISQLYPLKNDEETIEKFIEIWNAKKKECKAMKSEMLKEEYHYGNSSRISPIIECEEGYYVGSRRDVWPCRGQHGYNPNLSSMKSMFLAFGPSFKQNVHFSEQSNLNIYPLISRLLSLPLNPSNGTDSLCNLILI